jgi:N-acetylglucosamine-6-phosphate deacetylase
MSSLLLHSANLYTPTGVLTPGWLRIDGSRIQALGMGQAPEPTSGETVIDCAGKSLLPGFIDIHVHGALGREVMDADPDGLREMARFFAAHGVTGFLATTWTASRPGIQRVLATLGPLAGPLPGGATLLGFHLEGPFINRLRTGAQEKALIRTAGRDEALEYLESGLVRLIALAPEIPENMWLVDECVRRGIAVSAGHTDASYEQMVVAVQHGLRQVTHCYNAMSPYNHRAPGTVGAALAFPELRCELIADTIHVHPAALKITVAAKGPQGVILITDAIRGAGLPDGEYALDDHRRMIVRNHACYLPDGTLAGSGLTLEDGLRNLCAASGLSLAELWVASSQNAAQAIGIDHRKGSLQPGKDADLVLLNADGQVTLTIAEGTIVFNQ